MAMLRRAPVVVSDRDGYRRPLAVVVAGRVEWTVPVLNDRDRQAGYLGPDISGDADAVVDWDPMPRKFGPRIAPPDERDRLARTGRMEAAVDEFGRVCLVRIRPR